MAGFSEEELRAAANEAGVSPIELRQALAKREGTAVATTTANVEGGIALARSAALSAVRANVEAATGRKGHAQGDSRHDIVDDVQGLTYRIEAVSESNDETLVRVQVDTGAGRGALALGGAGVAGVAGTLTMIGWLFSVTTLWILGVVAAGIGGAWIFRGAMALAAARNRGEAIAAQALADAQSSAPLALGPGAPP